MTPIILGERPSKGGPYRTIEPSSTTRQLDRLRPGWELEFKTMNVWPYAWCDEERVDVDALDAPIIVALGSNVLAELGLFTGRWLEWQTRGDSYVLRMPHPSGVNRWYNDATNCRRASNALKVAVKLSCAAA